MVIVSAVQFASCGSENDVNSSSWFEDWQSSAKANLMIAEALIREAHVKEGAQIILLQEMFEGIYFPQVQHEKFFSIAKSSKVEDNPILQHMSKLAKELSVVLPVSFFERHNNAYYNSVVVFDSDGSNLGLYRKSHIPDGPGYQEKFYFNPGDTGFKVFHTSYGSIGIAVCWDQWFPEAARSMVLQGAEMLFYPTAIGSEPTNPDLDSRDHWMRVMQGHAAANLVPVIAANRIGVEGQLSFYGSSFICDHSGKIISCASRDKSEVITAEFNLNQHREDRAFWGLFRDRRPELYDVLQTLDGETSMEKRGDSERRRRRRRKGDGKWREKRKRMRKWRENWRETSSCSECCEWEGQRSCKYKTVWSQTLTTPLTDGFSVPAEWEPHEQCWMAWPVRTDFWRDDAKPAQDAFESVAREISKSEKVMICCLPSEIEKVNERFEDCSENIHIVGIEYNDAWMRDIGPKFVINRLTGEVRGVDWSFNAWGGENGGCYESCELDALVARMVLSYTSKQRYKCPLVFENGSVHCDNVGTLITTEECLLNPNRNPQCSKGDIERILKLYLGVKKVIWLPCGVYGDSDTNGHVDNLCCFVSDCNIVLTWTDDISDAQHLISKKAFEILSKETDALGRPLKIHKIHQPKTTQIYVSTDVSSLTKSEGTIQRKEGQRMAASYINFYISNGSVIMPKFNDPNDEPAFRMISSLFPSRKVIQIDNSREILLGGGNIHCITLEQPKQQQLVAQSRCRFRDSDGCEGCCDCNLRKSKL